MCCYHKPSKINSLMKRLLAILFCTALTLSAMAGDDVKINKENCTVTKDGKTYKLYGKWKVVDCFEDIKVKIVDCFEDVDIKIVDCFEDSCGKVRFVDSFEEVKVKFVDSFEDIKVKFVDHFEGVKK